MAEMSSNEDLVRDGLLSIPEACDWLGISRTALYGLMNRAELAWVKVGRRRCIPRRALVKFTSEGSSARTDRSLTPRVRVMSRT